MKFKEVESMLDDDKVFVNKTYQVNVKFLDETGMDGWVWLSIKRFDKEVINDWRIMQQIKNAIVGDDREGVELYPSEKRLVDTSNQFHIFAMPKGDRFPFGYGDRKIVEGHTPKESMGSGQRHFNDGEQPKDCLKVEEMFEETKKYIKEHSK